MNSTDFEIFYNWNNSLRTNDKIQYKAIQAAAKELLNKSAYSPSELEEILIAEGYKRNLIKQALVNDSSMSEDSVEQNVEVAAGVPKKYSDISHKFEKTLQSMGATKFVKLMTKGENPLMKVSKNELETFQKLADLAYENPMYYDTLHSYMRPSITAELAENVCKARSIRDKCSISQLENGSYKISHSGKIIEASVKPVSSTSEKFTKSNYGAFGFPDEYVILAYEESSPYAKIRKDLSL
jgi:hypothetical protein